MWRPAIDVLFRTAAVAYGNRVIGTLLSGQLDDGTSGLKAIKACGGLAIVQDPADALCPEMPRIAAANIEIDRMFRAHELARLLCELVQQAAGEPGPIPDHLRAEALIAQDGPTPSSWDDGATATEFTCPQCGGPLCQRSPDPALLRCLVGHAYRLDSLLHGIGAALDRTLWAAIRQFEQRAVLLERFAERERMSGRERVIALYLKRAAEAREHAANLRRLQAQR